MKTSLHTFLGIIILFIASNNSIGSNVIKGVDFDALFAPPTNEEIQDALADWKERLPNAEDCKIEGERTDQDGNRILIISHLVEGLRHYGGVVIPKLDFPDQKLPIFITYNYLKSSVIPETRKQSNYISVLPAYRGESVEDVELGFFRCEGESKNDFLRDIFDAVSFLEAVKKLVPNADTNFIVSAGSSRNCSTALSIGLFVPGTRAVFASCGWCDMFAEYIKSGAIKILEDYDTSENVFTFHNSLKTDVPLSFVLHAIIFPLNDGKMTLSQARRRLLESSPAYFTKWMPKYIKINHGTEDPAVNII